MAIHVLHTHASKLRTSKKEKNGQLTRTCAKLIGHPAHLLHDLFSVAWVCVFLCSLCCLSTKSETSYSQEPTHISNASAIRSHLQGKDRRCVCLTPSTRASTTFPSPPPHTHTLYIYIYVFLSCIVFVSFLTIPHVIIFFVVPLHISCI